MVITLNHLIGWSSRFQSWVYSNSDWIEIWVWMGNDGSEHYVYLYDSEGSSYVTCFYIDGYPEVDQIIICHDSSGVHFD